jgi:hypothetical protein
MNTEDQAALVEAMYAPVQQTSGVLYKEDLDQMLESLYDNAVRDPTVLYVSLPDAWRIRRAWLYRHFQMPRRTLRKCFLRRRQERIKQGRRWLARRQQREQRRLVKP